MQGCLYASSLLVYIREKWWGQTSQRSLDSGCFELVCSHQQGIRIIHYSYMCICVVLYLHLSLYHQLELVELVCSTNQSTPGINFQLGPCFPNLHPVNVQCVYNVLPVACLWLQIYSQDFFCFYFHQQVKFSSFQTTQSLLCLFIGFN